MKIYKISSEINMEKEAGMKESFSIGLMSALIALMGGSGALNLARRSNIDKAQIENAARVYNVNESEISSVLENPSLFNEFKQELSSLRSNNDVSSGKVGPKNQNGQTKDSIGSNSEESKKEVDSAKLAIPINIIARTLYAEGKGESEDGLNAIASVIYNRSNKTADGMVSVIKRPKQFSCWNKASASDWTNMKQHSGPMWEKSMSIAKSMVSGGFSPTGNWNHYYNPNLAKPDWAYITGKDGKKTIRNYETVGNHRFMNIKW